MFKRALFVIVGLALTVSVVSHAQMTPFYQWTLLPSDVMDEIIGEASGETAWNTIMATGGYNRDRLPEEYAGTFYESQYIYDQLLAYGLAGAEIARFPGGQVWDGIKGELWEVAPLRQKLASYQDMRAMLANGSANANVTADLVWVGYGTADELDRAGVAGKIVVTEGSIGNVHRLACLERGALGVVSIANNRPFFDPLQIPWSGVGSRGGSQEANKFGFFIPPREAADLKRRLLAGHQITVHAEVESTTQSYDLEDPVAYIPGTDPNAGEVILSAHLFEGYVKQGANDNKSGSAGILEVARTLHTLIEEGRIPRPKRTIRFLWGPEYSGTGPWVVANKDIMERTLANINMDMVGEWLSLNKGYMTLVRTSYGHPHFVNDVMENYFRFVGESNRERIQNRSDFYKVPRRIVAPTGADEPFNYSIETHYGASDHMVFNDWGVRSSRNHDDCLARSVVPHLRRQDRQVGPDPDEAGRDHRCGRCLHYSQRGRRHGHSACRRDGEQWDAAVGAPVHDGSREAQRSDGGELLDSYKWARAHVEAAVINEKATLAYYPATWRPMPIASAHTSRKCRHDRPGWRGAPASA